MVVTPAGLLETTLGLAVPLRIEELRERPVSDVHAESEARGKEWSEVIASQADVMLYGGGKKGQPAAVFNVLADALAHMAFVPGGVKVFGMRFSAYPDGGLLIVGMRPCAWAKWKHVTCLEHRAIDAMPTEEGTTFVVPEWGETWRHCGPEWGWRLAGRVEYDS